jgi:dTDP-4-amino-4,6-dideoxygalactose transaminase
LEVAQKMVRLRNYGASYKYFHTDPGTNSRLDTIQAAILLEKLPYLSQWNSDRLIIAKQYDTELASLATKGITPIQNHSHQGHVYHLYVIKIDETCSVERQEIQEQLAIAGIQTGIHYPVPCHMQPAFTCLGYQPGDFPHAEKMAKQILSLPMYPGLTTSQVTQVVSTLATVVQ